MSTPSFSDIFGAFFGFRPPSQSRLLVRGGTVTITNIGSEADMRRGLAQLAYMCGWTVQEEVVVPGWGRIDIVLTDPDFPQKPILIEVKLELKRPSDIRKAFQQADGYGRWWKVTKSQGAEIVLTAQDMDLELAGPISDAYPEVDLYHGGQVMAMLPHWRVKSENRWKVARHRLAIAEQHLEVFQSTIAEIDAIEKRGAEA